MSKKAFLHSALATTMMCLLSFSQALAMSPYDDDPISVSLSGRSPNNTVKIPGHFIIEDQNSLDGIVNRTVPFEVVPGEEASFDLKLWNPESVEITSEIVLCLDSPIGDSRDVFVDEITLDGYESLSFNYQATIPEDLEIYGRYTLRLLIDGRLADFFQFDMNSRNSIEVRWDDGVMVNAWAFYELCNVWAIKGCLPDGAILDSVGVYILSENDPYWPWPDDSHQDILVQIFDNDGPSGMPGTLLYSDVTRVTPGTSHAVSYPDLPISSAFYIANDQLTDYPACEGQGVDGAVDYPDQMFTRIDDEWENAGYSYDGDFMIWGVAHVGGERITVGNLPEY